MMCRRIGEASRRFEWVSGRRTLQSKRTRTGNKPPRGKVAKSLPLTLENHRDTAQTTGWISSSFYCVQKLYSTTAPESHIFSPSSIRSQSYSVSEKGGSFVVNVPLHRLATLPFSLFVFWKQKEEKTMKEAGQRRTTTGEAFFHGR